MGAKPDKRKRSGRKHNKHKVIQKRQLVDTKKSENVEIEYLTSLPDNEHFNDVFAHFVPATETESPGNESAEESADEEEQVRTISAKKQRRLDRMTVAQLKSSVLKPDVVDWVDVCAADPKLLVELKSYRNTVPVPIHWSQKRKYLSAKRGIIKKPFELPDFIKATGIMEMRESIQNKEAAAGIKGKVAERMAPRMGKLDIDYQKLHDAFFRWQKKPTALALYGDLYWEGKEFETRLKTRKPGDLSDDLLAALNMPSNAPPPWLLNMQRYGPPPAYPNLRIPGLNAPIPAGCQWGFHPGGWGKPPVDEFNRPLYGDVFGLVQAENQVEEVNMEPIERTLWGELESEDEESESESEEEEEEAEAEPDENDDVTYTYGDTTIQEETIIPNGLYTPSGFDSVPSGLETPDHIELRKQKEESKPLYTVIPSKSTNVSTTGLMGSSHTYDMKKQAGVEVSLNPEELETLNEEDLQRKYEARSKGEDMSEMVAEHVEKRKEGKKRKSKKDGFKF